MKKDIYKKIAKDVINTEIVSLNKLKNSLDTNFKKAVEKILECKKGKIILSGVGKSGIIARKISSTLASVGTPSFFVDASSCSHGDLGQISSNDILILISNSGESIELKNIIQFANRNKILLIGIVSKKDSILHKASDIKLLIPQVNEAGGIVPTSSTTSQLALGDALAIAVMRYKKFGTLDFKKLHPSGSLGAQLKTVEDIMITGKKIPFVNENIKMKNAFKILSEKKLGILIARNKLKRVTGIITDGQVRRFSQKNPDFQTLSVKKIMTKKPLSIDKDELAAKALSIMNNNKITSLIVINKKNPLKAIGVVHVHTILQANIA